MAAGGPDEPAPNGAPGSEAPEAPEKTAAQQDDGPSGTATEETSTKTEKAGGLKGLFTKLGLDSTTLKMMFKCAALSHRQRCPAD